MRKFLYFSVFLINSTLFAQSQIWDKMRISNILEYGKEGSTKLGLLFTTLQAEYFRPIFLGILVAVPLLFLLHYLVIGAKVFSHGGKKIYFFSLFKRIIHWLAALAFVILVPTGLMIAFGGYFGGGELIANARHLHGVATLVFIVAVIPMFLFWVFDMLPSFDDVKWMFILGGYLSKSKKEIPAGKFNAGQKMWFWLATLGGFVMIATGGAMYFQDFNFGIASFFGLSQIDLLRAAAIVHNILAFAIIALFITHIYMSMFAIKGALQSMISGYKEEEEVKYLHSSFYKKLKKEGKV